MSSQDMAKFLLAVLNKDSRILSKASWENFLPTEDSESIPDNWRGFFGTLGGTGGSITLTEFIPEIKTGYIAITNLGGSVFSPSVYDVIGSVSISLLLLNDEFAFTPNDFGNRTLPNPSTTAIDSIKGTYTSPLGIVELFQKGDELHGTILGHEFKLESVNFSYLIRSDFDKINGLLLKADNQQLTLEDRPFAFRVK